LGTFYLATADLNGNVAMFYQFPSSETPLFIALYASDGNCYGVSVVADGSGDVFSLDAGPPLPRPWAQQFTPALGSVGANVRIWGHNLTVANSGSNYIWATAPPGATPGPITVTTQDRHDDRQFSR
jgi:hypothetical protein